MPRAIRIARQRAERDLLAAKEALERKTEELQQQREWFQVTLASIGDAVITTDVEGKVTYLNPVAESMTGWSFGASPGRAPRRVFQIINESHAADSRKSGRQSPADRQDRRARESHGPDRQEWSRHRYRRQRGTHSGRARKHRRRRHCFP